MFENLTDKLSRTIRNLRGVGKLSEENVKETLTEVRKALLSADVHFRTVKEFIEEVENACIGQEVLKSVSPGQQVIKIINDELIKLLGEGTTDLREDRPLRVMMVGLHGAGKTTTSAKLAKRMAKDGRSPMLVACDIYRPAAINQLHVVGEQIGVEVYSEPENKNPVEIAQNAIKHAKSNGFNVVIVDTAGRLAVDEEMMTEIANVHKAIQPQETLFVVDSMTGQDAVNTAKAFNDRLNFDGVILTKLDGDTRGGAAISIKSVVNKPIKFIGTGEKMDALDVFHPERMADRILGKGDVVSLVERAQQAIDEKEAQRLEAKLRKNTFDLEDFFAQIQQIKKMGNVKDLLGMVPGMGKALKGIDVDDNAFLSIESIIQSMTPAERSNPGIINGSRRARIAKGCGRSVEEVNRLLKQFEDMKKMMGMMAKGGMPRIPGMRMPGTRR